MADSDTMEVLIPSYLTHSPSHTPDVTVVLKSPGSDHQVVLPGLAPDSRGYVHIQVECLFNLPGPPTECPKLEPASEGFSFAGMFSWATEGLKNRLFVFGNTSRSPVRSLRKPYEPCTTTPQPRCLGPHGGPVIYANNRTGFFSASPPPVQDPPRTQPSIKDVAAPTSLSSSAAAASSIPFIYRDGSVFVPRHDDPSLEDHERRHELENILHPLLPPTTPEKATTTRESAWLESRHASSSELRDDVVANVAPGPTQLQPQPALASTSAPVTLPPDPAPAPVQAPVVAGPSPPLTRKRGDESDAKEEEEGDEERPRTRRRTQ
ncbi:uncharacterized protein EV420DRAFT_1482005 [Desarmillaria tabescens]|uniref:Uncharacterized protein n=1 Tax=Armillaria tabescens TaxID=1929756 RepID=A0AA39K3Z8_ARMTA|nr:uncharacterized protein EV420DRAFT_1482005 [Desarmillaria tabescens]KAK0453015.1 hypothetical protein EV420DRAFT_1482005 [Desarmillaria tabescens]